MDAEVLPRKQLVYPALYTPRRRSMRFVPLTSPEVSTPQKQDYWLTIRCLHRMGLYGHSMYMSDSQEDILHSISNKFEVRRNFHGNPIKRISTHTDAEMVALNVFGD